MAKEMIVSVNGREKKIAILEDGKVTEFYIERGEENTGVVGNIYKGRVQRVLPGMQSAFVDIGLERDAFLYVSDFFDEEEEFERIVMEKSKKADPATAEKVASEKLQQARLEREQQMEAIQERVEPLAEKKKETKKEKPKFTRVQIEELEEIADEILVEEPERDEPDVFEMRETSAAEVRHLTPLVDDEPEAVTPFIGEESNFERIVDDEAETEGDLFKEARIQERIADQVRAVEFEIEPTPSVEVGTLVLDTNANNFERIADDEETAPQMQSTETKAEAREKQERGRRGRRGGKQKAETMTTKQTEPEKLSEASEQVNEQASDEQTSDQPQSRKKQRGGNRKAEKNDGKSGRNKNQTNETAAPETIEENVAVESADRSNESVESASRRKRRGKSIEAAPSINTDTETAVQTETQSGETSVSDAMTSNYADADASVDDLGTFRSEMAVRRGGRRRRGGSSGGNRRSPNAPHESAEHDGKSDDEIEESENGETEELTLETTDARSDNGRSSNRVERAERPERVERGERNERRERSERGGRDRRPPTITDLLREGQEILVQIAKEPIAKKGARITSHIALPGRYIVYMPTIEHVGVSRKIESSHERIRLRNMIQKIRNEENVPSGGFIVRTAGVGITEQDLRDDARYLVRTWTDIRRQAEKVKSPALVHQDLDLVERILRDQLSEDFAAIRVDDEAEYLRVVEFINRMSPRLANRVKFYTRDTPIMEAYGVQEEIDKAVKPRVWLKSGGYLVINQTEALVSIDVNTGKFVGKGANRLEDTITKTNMEAVEEIARQVRLRDLGGIIVLDLIDMEDRKNRQRVLQALQEALQSDKSPTKVLSFNDFGLIVMTRKRVKQSLERTLCSPCHYCQGAGLIKSAQTVCYEILAEARRLSKDYDDGIKQTTLRVHPEIAKALRSTERDVLTEIEDYLGAVDLTADPAVHQEQFDFAFV